MVRNLRTIAFTLATTGLIALGSAASAASITSYDVTNAQPSGFGNWSHTYSGTISAGNYTGGSGTLNDGIIPNDQNNNQLFTTSFLPTITAYLDGTYNLNQIDVLSDYLQNAIPGNLLSFDVTIGGNTQTVALAGFGATTSGGYSSNGRATLTGLLQSTATNNFTLSNFVTSGSSGFADFFSIGELTVNGVTANSAVPEPATWAMLLIGFGFAGAAMRRRKNIRVSFA